MNAKQKKRIAEADAKQSAAVEELRKAVPIGAKVWFVLVKESSACTYYRVLSGDKSGVHDITIQAANATKYTMRRVYGRYAIDASQWQALCYSLAFAIHGQDAKSIRTRGEDARHGKTLGALRAKLETLEKSASLTSKERNLIRKYQVGYTLKGENL